MCRPAGAEDQGLGEGSSGGPLAECPVPGVAAPGYLHPVGQGRGSIPGEGIPAGAEGPSLRQAKVPSPTARRKGERSERRERESERQRRQDRSAEPKRRKRCREMNVTQANERLERTVKEVMAEGARIEEVVHAVTFQWGKGSTAMRKMLTCILEQENEKRSGSSFATSQKDLFPLPVNYVDEVCEDDRAEVCTWVKLMVVVLNYLYLQTTRPAVEPGVNEAQKACVTSLKAAVEVVVREAPEVKPLATAVTHLKQARFDYAGEPVAVMEELEADKVIPCWPAPGEAAIQPAVNFVPPQMRALLERPEVLLLPQEQWPESPPQSRVRASDEEWAKICKAAHERKMMVPVKEKDVFKDHQGRPVFNGAMAVVKVKRIGGEDKQLQRFISNLVPSNSYQAHLPGDDVHLPYLGQLAMLSIHPDEELVVDSEDLTSCFNLFSLPRAWAPYMAFGKAVDGSVFGLARGEQVFPAMAVIPMGWLSAVALTQAIVRHLVFDLSGVKVESEVRKTAAFPADDEFSVIYLDSFDELRRMDAGLAAVSEGQPSDNHLAFQETCRRLGLPLNEGKKVVAATRGALQGGEVDGRAGTFFLARDKQSQLVGLTAALLEAEKVTEFELRHWTGKVIFGMSFRRPLMSVLEAVFMDITRAEMGPVVLSPAAVDEVVAVLAMIPLMSMNLRAVLDDEVVVTDASPSGGGAAVATRFKKDPDTVDYTGDVCLECDGQFGDWGRFPCPSSCGGVFCSLQCIHAHRSGSCVRKSYPCPKFGERFSGPNAPLSHAVAKRGGIQVQEPFDWFRGRDFFNQNDKQRLEELESDPLLKAEHWAPECKLMSRARGRPITLASGRVIKGPQPVRDSKHIMGFPWLSGDMKARLRRSNAMALRGQDLPDARHLA